MKKINGMVVLLFVAILVGIIFTNNVEASNSAILVANVVENKPDVLKQIKQDIVELEESIKIPPTRFYAVNLQLLANADAEVAFKIGVTLRNVYLIEFPYCQLIDRPLVTGQSETSLIISINCVTIQ